MRAKGDKLTFFRQSGWMVMATVAGGFFMSAVHVVVNKPMTESEYAVFFALLRVFLLMGFPAGGLQVVFAQQAAAAVSEREEQRLAQTTRSVLRAAFLIWLGIAALVFLFRGQILALLKIANPAALWVTVLLGLASLWAPVLRGLLQGRQNFAGLGWVLILDGVGRFTAIVLIVQLGGQAAGAMTGALIGQIVSLSVAAALVWRIVAGPGAPFVWRPWLRRVVPLTFGVGVVLFMGNADVIYVQSVFAKGESPFYMAAAMIGLALVTFTTPLAAVMFPKIVRSAARTEKTNALQHALAATALLGGLAAVACTLGPALPLRIIYFRNSVYWASAPLVPWFAWCLLPLILTNVLISNLLARERFRIVPWALIVAIGYGATLLALRERITAFSARDIKDFPELTQRLETRSDPISASLWDEIPARTRAQFTARQYPIAQRQRILAAALDGALKGPFYQPSLFAQVRLSKQAVKLLAKDPRGKDLKLLNRMLLHDAFPADIASSEQATFRGFKMVVGTLGAFSSLLLLAAIWFTFSQRNGLPRASA
jgi:O-antigen/teichoic acid export membrane protein